MLLLPLHIIGTDSTRVSIYALIYHRAGLQYAKVYPKCNAARLGLYKSARAKKKANNHTYIMAAAQVKRMPLHMQKGIETPRLCLG